MNNINEYILKITGGVCLNQEIDATKVVQIKNGDIAIYAVEKRDNEDGTYDIVYKGRFTSALDFTQGGKAIRGRDKTNESKKTRYTIKCFASEKGEEDTEEFYKTFQQKIRSNVDEVWDFLKDL